MAETSRDLRDQAPVVSSGLRLRIWIGCLGAALLGATGVLGVAGTFLPVSSDLSPTLVASLPWIAAALPLLAGMVLALWLERGILRPVRDMSQALLLQDDAALRRLGDASAWGELASLASSVRTLLMRLELCARETEDLRVVRDRLREQAITAASALEHDLAMAREAVEHSERGFVEATGLLSSLREIERLVGELAAAQVGDSGGEILASQRVSLDGFRDAATLAIEELAAASAASVERLARGLTRVQEIAEQAQVLGNRATLIALEAATHRGRDAVANEDLMGLARDAQAATARTDELARDVDREVTAASQHMRGVRERTAETLARAPHLLEPPPRTAPQLLHLIDRLRDTIGDAASKGERLAASAERASSAVERLVRRIEADALALEALVESMGSEPMEAPE